MKTVTLGTNRFAVDDRGSGPPVLFVHGFPLDHTMWQAQCSAFESTYRVIAPDLRGFGASDVTIGTVTMEQMADDCAAILDALGVAEPVALIGLSMGGYVAWQFLRKHAARLGKLVLCDTRAAADTPQGGETRLKMAEHVLAHGTSAVAEAMLPKLFAPSTAERHPHVVDAVRQMILHAPPQGVAAAQRGMAQRLDMTAMLPTIKTQTLVICGEHDAISPLEEMRGIAADIPGARLAIIRDAGHMAPMENPLAVNAALREFLAG